MKLEKLRGGWLPGCYSFQPLDRSPLVAVVSFKAVSPGTQALGPPPAFLNYPQAQALKADLLRRFPYQGSQTGRKPWIQ